MCPLDGSLASETQSSEPWYPGRQMPRSLEVCLTPASLADPARKVCIVIDVLRATSALVTMFARGVTEALVADSIEEARKLAGGRPGALLCGEEGGLRPPGFDYGNSPSEFDTVDLAGRRAIIATSNGTRALVKASACPVVLVGALLNLRAVVAHGLDFAGTELDVTFLCAGEGGGTSASLEDTFCAGAMVEEAATHGGEDLVLGADAKAARRLYRSYGGSASEAMCASTHATVLRELGLGLDVDFCARTNVWDVVPRLGRTAAGELSLAAIAPAS